MIRGEEDARGIVDQQEQLQPRRPLHGVVKVGRAIIIRHDSAAVRIAVDDRPFLWAGPADRAELTRHVARNRHRLAKHDLTHVDGNVLMSIDAFGQARRGGGEPLLAFHAVGIELYVSEMQRQTLRRFDRRDDGIGPGGKADLGQARRGGGEPLLAFHAVGIKLYVSEMQRQTLRRFDRRDDGIGPGGKAEIVYLPTYSPNLNLIERLWKFV